VKHSENRVKCLAEYNKLMRTDIPKKDLTEDDLNAIEEEKKRIREKHDALFSRKPGEGRKYGDVCRIMDNASKDLSAYVGQFFLNNGMVYLKYSQVNTLYKQGVAVGGWGVSLDDDPDTNYHNFTFAGGAPGMGYFSMKRVNLKALMSEYQLYGK
jgi:hypothetical protein